MYVASGAMYWHFDFPYFPYYTGYSSDRGSDRGSDRDRSSKYMDERIPQLRTTGVIAHELSQPIHRVLHVLRTRQHIHPTARAGRLRLYDRDAVAMIRHELNSIDAQRKDGPFA